MKKIGIALVVTVVLSVAFGGAFFFEPIPLGNGNQATLAYMVYHASPLEKALATQTYFPANENEHEKTPEERAAEGMKMQIAEWFERGAPGRFDHREMVRLNQLPGLKRFESEIGGNTPSETGTITSEPKRLSSTVAVKTESGIVLAKSAPGDHLREGDTVALYQPKSPGEIAVSKITGAKFIAVKTDSPKKATTVVALN